MPIQLQYRICTKWHHGA